jgi:hypothetical protein
VTDFLSRVAARAVGMRSGARPRNATIFAAGPPPVADERAGDEAQPAQGAILRQPLEGDLSVETLGEETLLRPTEAVWQAAPARAVHHESRGTAPVAQSSTGSPPLVVEAGESRLRTPRATESSRPDHEAELPLPPPSESPGVPPTSGPVSVLDTGTEAAAVPAFPSAAVVADSLPDPIERVDPATPREPETAVVRVHIGRLEVRANVQEAPRPARRESVTQPRLSLTEYLRGERAVR